ncbi:hypothetical protein CC78DRAFT_530414 [Lojkania enalia]|uniref:Uncharacterized protein n=1 Tax=Lojkania enalia TaxID=147567 RepID=A0A9P4N6W6_9PLEO|nr:hypothetical protein CC78DRAFT_530414 [Didymosphaeria enalia]
MCLYIFAYSRSCEEHLYQHKEWLGLAHCGLDISNPNHRFSCECIEDSGFECEICLIKQGETIDPDDVHYYPPANLKVTKIMDNGTEKIVHRPPYRRGCTSLSGTGSQDSFGSMAAHTFGLGLSEKIDDCDSSLVHPHFTYKPTNNLAANEQFSKSETPMEQQDRIAENKKDPTPFLEPLVSPGTIKHRALLQYQLRQLPQHLARQKIYLQAPYAYVDSHWGSTAFCTPTFMTSTNPPHIHLY